MTKRNLKRDMRMLVYGAMLFAPLVALPGYIGGVVADAQKRAHSRIVSTIGNSSYAPSGGRIVSQKSKNLDDSLSEISDIRAPAEVPEVGYPDLRADY